MENMNNVLYFMITLEDKYLFDSSLLASIVYKMAFQKSWDHIVILLLLSIAIGHLK